MSGIHTIFRQSTSTSIISISSTLYLPKTTHYRKNVYENGIYKDGAFPEFFHGFYKGSQPYGLDAGVLYGEDGVRLFFFSYAETQATQRFISDNEIVVPTNRMVTLKSWFENGNLCTRACDGSGNVLCKLDVPLIRAAYNAMTSGCSVNREMCLAMNTRCTMPAPAYFSQTKFTDTIMCTKNGSEVKMSADNSTLKVNRVDLGVPSNYKNYYAEKHLTATEVGGFIADVATATADKSQYPVSPIAYRAIQEC